MHDVHEELGAVLVPFRKGNATASLPEPQPGRPDSEEESETRGWP